MRVTHVITRLIIGGAQENTVATVLGLREIADVQVALISGSTGGPEGSLEPLLTTHPGLLTVLPSLVRPVSPVRDWLALRQLTHILYVTRPEIVHTHSGKGGILGRLAARRAKVPVIVHHIHGPSFGPFQGGLANAIFKAAERYAARATTHFVCVANAMARLYLNAGIGTPVMYTRVFSGFDVKPFLSATNDLELRKRLGFQPGDFVIGKVARLTPLKGHHDLIIALKKLLPRVPHARLLFIGDGAARAEIQTEAAALGLRDKIVFAGLVPPEAVAQYIGVMDCLAHLSYREGLARALPQALAARRPVVSYELDGADEICIEGETGFLVPMGETAMVAERLAQLAGAPELRQRLGRAGQAIVAEQFPVERMVDRLYRLYMQLLGKPSARILPVRDVSL